MPLRTRIHTKRLLLRSWRLSDVEAYDEACNTPEVMRWLGGVQTRAQVRREVLYFMRAEDRDGFTFWAVENDERLLGFCGLLRIREKDCPFSGAVEIGWRIRGEEWRRGYGFEASNSVLRRAFNELGLERVISRAAAANKASQGLMRKLGMRRRRAMDYVPLGEDEALAVFDITRQRRAGARDPIR